VFGSLIGLFGDGETKGKGFVSIMELVGSVLGFLVVGPIKLLIGILEAIIGTVRWVVDVFTVFYTIAARVGTWLVEKLTPAFDFVGEKVTAVVDTIRSVWSSIIDTIVGLVPDWLKNGASAISAGASRMGDAVSGAWNVIKNPLSWITGDDMVSRSGYGERTLVTPGGNVALNNSDNVVAYADDMIARNTGIDLLSKGAIVNSIDSSSPNVNVNVDLAKLEQKLDAVVRAISMMEVRLDGNRVGAIIAGNDQRAGIDGVFRAQRL
jgi:hypothetical protein